MGKVAEQSGTDRPVADLRFEQVYERHYGNIRAYCARRVSAARVDDAVAETFLTAWRRRDDLPETADALAWLYRVAYRVVGHEWRSNSRRRRLTTRLSAVRPAGTVSPEEAAVQVDETSRVLEAAARLRADDSEILRLVSWERLSRTEIATILDLSPNTVSKRLQRARENLTREYERLERRPAGRRTGIEIGGPT